VTNALLSEPSWSAALSNPARALDALDRWESEQSLISFIERGWHTLEPPTRPFVRSRAIDRICEHLEAVHTGQITRLLMNVPPGCTKSMTTNVFMPAWIWGPQRRPDRRFISWSYAENLTLRDNRRCRNLITSAWYQRLWSDRFCLSDDQNQKVKFENDHRGWKFATSVGGVGTGERGDILIVDDPHNVLEAESALVRKNALQWFAEVLPTRLNDPSSSAIVVIMQRVHEEDVSGLILAHELGYEHLMLPMRFEEERRSFTVVPNGNQPRQQMRYLVAEQRWVPEQWQPDPAKDPAESHASLIEQHAKAPTREVYAQDVRTAEGELLDIERFPQEVVDRDEKVLSSVGGSYAVAGQMQQRPTARGGGMFLREWFTIVDAAPVDGKRVRYWDKAGTEGGGDWTAGVRIVKTPEGKYYVEDVVKGQWSSGTRNKNIKLTAELDTWSVAVWVEQEPGSGGKESAEFSLQDLAGYDVHKEPVSGDKETRARPFAAQCEAGNVYLVKARWNKEFIDELCGFPMGKHDDQVDGASGAFNKLALGPTGFRIQKLEGF
jgi:predicted phage terminase large subunit-like protein